MSPIMSLWNATLKCLVTFKVSSSFCDRKSLHMWWLYVVTVNKNGNAKNFCCITRSINQMKNVFLSIILSSHTGCSFTKYCKDNALQFNIKGWVKNSKRGTIVGKMQGVKIEVDKMYVQSYYVVRPPFLNEN